MSDHQEQLHEELEQIRVVLHQMASEAHQVASEAPEPSPRAPSTGAPPPDRSVQVIVEIEARAVTVERLFMISERQEWTFGETLSGTHCWSAPVTSTSVACATRRRRCSICSRSGVDDGYSMRGIAVELDKRKVETPRGGAWHPQLVKRIVQRLDAKAQEQQ
jgi:hypothetical protein